MLRSAFVDAPDALNGPPFLLLDDWTQFAAAYSPFADGSPRSLAALDALQDEVVTWWQRYKRAQQEKLRRLIDGVMDH